MDPAVLSGRSLPLIVSRAYVILNQIKPARELGKYDFSRAFASCSRVPREMSVNYKSYYYNYYPLLLLSASDLCADSYYIS